MNDKLLPIAGSQPEILTLINAELEKVQPCIKEASSPSAEPPLSPLLSQEPQPSVSVPSQTTQATDVEAVSVATKEAGQHLKAETFAEQVIPIDQLNGSVQSYIQTIAEAFGCPQDYVTIICFITAGIAAGKKVQFVTNPYVNYPSDYVCIVGKPSRNKTGPLIEVTRPLREYDKATFDAYVKERAAYDQKKQEDKHFCGDRPLFHQHVVGDSSPESRNSLLAQGDMILISADELKSFIDSFGRYAKGGNGSGTEVSQLLSIWSNVSFTINRKSEETRLVDNPAMSIVGGIQPNPLGRTFGTDALMDSGFTQRFLFVYPDKTKFVKRHDRKQMTQEMRDIWSGIIQRLFEMEPLSIHLSHEAERLYADYADANDMKADAETDDYIGGVKQKMNIHVLRLSIMAHLLSDHWKDPVIIGDEMNYAIRVADYFTRTHVERIYPLLRETNAGQRPMTSIDLIRAVNKRFKIKSQKLLAEALGVSQQYVNKILKEQ